MKRTLLIVLAIISGILLVVVIGLVINKYESNNVTTLASPTSVITTSTYTYKNDVIIEIKGAVKYPGVYTFESDDITINSLILVAGGLLSSADISDINLAQLLNNHSSVYIGYKTDNTKSYILDGKVSSSLININTASKEELMSLNGIGSEIANAIIAYRKEGYFTTIEEIMNVNGIKEAVFEKIKDYITV